MRIEDSFLIEEAQYNYLGSVDSNQRFWLQTYIGQNIYILISSVISIFADSLSNSCIVFAVFIGSITLFISVIVCKTNRNIHLTLPILRSLSFKAQKPSKPCQVGINWKALAQYEQESVEYESDVLPYAKVSVIFQLFFASLCIRQISHQQHKG